MKLYDLTTAHRQLAIELIDADELTESQTARLDALDSDIATKVRNIVAMVREWRVEAEGYRGEARRLSEMAQRREKRADSLTDYAIYCLDAAGIERAKTDIGTVAVAFASRPSIRWTGAGPIPDEYIRTKVELDGDKAYAAFKAESLPDGFTAVKSRFLKVT